MAIKIDRPGEPGEYDDGMQALLQIVWGDGFLSPGGPAEIARLLEGVDLRGARVLDIGCGLGAIDVLLVANHGAGHVVGIDLEPDLVAKARQRVTAAGLEGRIELRTVEVDPGDPAFDNPTKPVGKFFTEAQAREMATATGWYFAEDSGRGWRRMVASPKPKKILDLKTIDALLDAGVIPIACGGGGVPVLHGDNGHWTGVAAVIDKDLTSAMLAAHLHADALIMLTGVEQVALDFNKPTQRSLDHMTLAQARQYTADGQFPPGSMGPKIEAAISYLEELPNANHDGEVIITSLERAFDALMGRAGTHITCKAPIR